MKKSIRLYNILLPIWLVWLFPPIIFICILVNSIVDFLVIFLSAKFLKIKSPMKVIKTSLLKVIIFGFISDLIGTIFLLLIVIVNFDNRLGLNDISEAIMNNPFTNVFSLLLVIIAIIISAYFIYLFNIKYSFAKLDIDDLKKKKLALSLAILTAPYTFLIPTSFFYQFSWY